MGAGGTPHYQVEGKSQPPGAQVPGFPGPLAKDKSKPGLCAKKCPLRKWPQLWAEHLQSSLCVEFLFL